MINPDGLMMIEPVLAIQDPVLDEYTALAVVAMKEAAVTGSARYRGWHTCSCGERSDNKDWTVRGLQTNSLLVHYVKYHRLEVPLSELKKLEAFGSETLNVKITGKMLKRLKQVQVLSGSKDLKATLFQALSVYDECIRSQREGWDTMLVNRSTGKIEKLALQWEQENEEP